MPRDPGGGPPGGPGNGPAPGPGGDPEGPEGAGGVPGGGSLTRTGRADRAALVRTIGVTWLLTNIASSAETIPTTAPVWAGVQCHQPKAMPRAMKASTSAIAAADSCLTQPTISFHTVRVMHVTTVSSQVRGHGGR